MDAPSAPIIANTAALAKATEKPTQSMAPADKQPCNWELSWENDELVGKNIVTGHAFRGTKAEFSDMLKG